MDLDERDRLAGTLPFLPDFEAKPLAKSVLPSVIQLGHVQDRLSFHRQGTSVFSCPVASTVQQT
jgi:hypothetical protein